MAGGAVLTRQGNGVVSKVAHHHLGGMAIACRPGGVKSALVAAEGREVDCTRCLKSMGERGPRWEADQVEVTPTIPEGDPYEPTPEDLAEIEAAKAKPKQVTPAPGRSRKQPYDVAPEPGAQSMTLREVLGFIQQHKSKINAGLPIRACGRFDSESTLAVMVGGDGALVVMGVD